MEYTCDCGKENEINTNSLFDMHNHICTCGKYYYELVHEMHEKQLYKQIEEQKSKYAKLLAENCNLQCEIKNLMGGLNNLSVKRTYHIGDVHLKDCPFCQSAAKMTQDMYSGNYVVGCGNYGCHAAELEMTIEEWNSRPTEDDLNDKLHDEKLSIGMWTIDENVKLHKMLDVAMKALKDIIEQANCDKGISEKALEQIEET